MKLSNTLILLFCLSLTACQESANTPKQVSEQYWQAIKYGDIAAAQKLVSQGSQQDFDSYLALPDEDKIPLDEVLLDDEHARVNTTVISKIESRTVFDTILVLENGQWKIDAAQTLPPSAKKPADEDQLSDALQENLDTMDEALDEGAEMLNEFVQEGSKEMSETLLKGMDKMNDALRDAVEKMKQRRELEKQEQPANNQNGEGFL